MYRHLLVPVADTDVSIEAVGNAVGLAHAVGAHITFFHAAAGEPGGEFPGKASELLAKAEAAARACGVPCDAKQVRSDQPNAALVEAARAGGCDLVFMARPTGGDEPGRALASMTIGAVIDAGLQLLVSRADGAGPPARAIAIIRDEHRSLAAVLHACVHALAAARSAGVAADAPAMRDIVRYLQLFPLALHDPKEDEHLFGRLRARTSMVNAELDELQRQHHRDRLRVADLAQRVDTLAAASGEAAVSATRELDDAVRSYAAFVWEHLGREEGVVLPAARRHLTDDDWIAIDDAFVKNREPLVGAEADAGQLFARIVTAAQARG